MKNQTDSKVMNHKTIDCDYTGWVKWHPADEDWGILESYGRKDINILKLRQDFPECTMPKLYKNQYLLVYSTESGESKHIKTYFRDGDFLRVVARETIEYKPDKADAIKISAYNDEQICAINMLRADSSWDEKRRRSEGKTIKLITGRWGSGKTLLETAAALEHLEDGRFDRIIWIRNNVDVKDTKDIGALPGEAIDKLLPFLGPFIDHAGEDRVRCMISSGRLVVAPLNFLRGRNFKNSIIICSECENLTREHMQLIIARAAGGTEVWFDGDSRQVDKPIFERDGGIAYVVNRFKGKPRFGYVHLTQCERSDTAAMADLLDLDYVDTDPEDCI